VFIENVQRFADADVGDGKVPDLLGGYTEPIISNRTTVDSVLDNVNKMSEMKCF
jgi:hypothetical protein